MCYAAPETVLSFGSGATEASVTPLSLEEMQMQMQIATAALDIWSLGVIAIELLTNINVLSTLSSNSATILAARGIMAYPWESQAWMFASHDSIVVLEGVSYIAVREVLEGCLSRDPSRRPSAVQVVNALS